MGATDIRDSTMGTVDSAGLNEGRERAHKLEKARLCGRVIVIDEADDTNDDLIDLEIARIRSQPVFRWPPSMQKLQQREKTTSSSRSSEISDTYYSLSYVLNQSISE